MIRQYFLDYCINYLLNNKAPNSFQFPTDKPIFGFRVYLTDSDANFFLLKKENFLTYSCVKLGASNQEKDITYKKEIKNKSNIFNTNELKVNLYYNNYEMIGVSPLIAYLVGLTRFYKLHNWFSNWVFNRSLKKNIKALSLYKDRFKLLQASISIYEDLNESDDFYSEEGFTMIVDGSIEINAALMKLTNSNDISAIYASRDMLDPILRSLEYDEVLQIQAKGNIKLLPKAWSELSRYYIEERRHADYQKSLRWQRVLMFLLFLASLATAIFTFIRPDVQNSIKQFFS